ncbi:MAG: hypothetical protein KatS3mg057_1018 [Herpetosiphonaceae bacterium]|nr:MAG: hypothetical protein KatS3mg057_1018 [Herpetosiphonaceae bacterium]
MRAGLLELAGQRAGLLMFAGGPFADSCAGGGLNVGLAFLSFTKQLSLNSGKGSDNRQFSFNRLTRANDAMLRDRSETVLQDCEAHLVYAGRNYFLFL